MRSDDEDDEEEFDEENDEYEVDQLRNNGLSGSPEDEEERFEAEDGSDEAEEDADVEVDDDEDEDEEEDNEGDDDDDEDEDDEEDADDRSDDDDPEVEDIDMTANGEDDEAGSTRSGPTTTRSKARSPVTLPPPPHLIRRSLFTFPPPANPPSIEAIVAIPCANPIHSISLTTCASILLTGSQEGYVRAYDFWGSVNGNQLMTAHQKTFVGLGEGINKAGVGKGWWANEVEGINGMRMEPVYSMACEGDGLWAATGTQSGPINLYTIRHSPGHRIHTLKGHTNVVSCLSLLPGEKGLLSGSWDGTVREWDLNTGQTVRTYPTHGAQISSLSLRPYTTPLSPAASSHNSMEENTTDKVNVSISVGPNFAEKAVDIDTKEAEKEKEEALPHPGADNSQAPEANGDIEMTDNPSPFDPLFDEDAEGETVPPSGEVTIVGTPAINDMAPPPSPPKPRTLGLALPGAAPTPSTSTSASTPLFNVTQAAASSSVYRQAASNIPLLSPASYKSFSDDILLVSSMDGQVSLIDRRLPSYENTNGVGRLTPGDKAPPWCMSACWSADGSQILAGRRNGTIDIWDVRKSSSSSAPNLLRTLRTSPESGPVSCVVPLPDGKHIATASQDNVRLWNTAEYFEPEENARKKTSKRPFKIIAGHHGGIISSMLVDVTGRFLVTASGDRGWAGETTRVVLVHEIKW
ncbi:WD40-repeat-containing domain protein [Naematelia encephala]|uniref:WD40-repeat-containing domain protein n=1 Tax=Naematelia encephala TaxID=71784 RepID=A0A1Y2BKN4_9TREE|nr:WD40-repeat-containing domain protein [Naematelia encephala]